VTLYGDGRAAILGDAEMAGRLGWGARRRSRPAPEIVLVPREGNPRREPWVCPPRIDPAAGVEAFRRGARRKHWSYLSGVPGVPRYLARLAATPDPRGVRVGLAGVGRVGGTAAAVLTATPVKRSGIRELLIYDVDGANLERWQHELGSIAGFRSGAELPRVRPTALNQVFHQCDVFVFAATVDVPALGTQEDVRMVQFAPNRAILRSCLEQARAAGFAGLFLVVSDPVDWLCLAAFLDSQADAAGGFSGLGLAPERIAGIGLGVMWGRALMAARREGWENEVAASGAAYGPHGKDVLVFDDLRNPSAVRSEHLSYSAREGNMIVRHLGFLPYVAPAVSSVALALPRLLAGEEVLASTFVRGLYFGGPSRHDFGVHPSPHPMAAEVLAQLESLHARLTRQSPSLGLP
jgi:hypothetical protein